MRILLPAAAVVLLFASTPASAANLCNCCGAGTAENCAAACESAKPAEGMCIPAVDFAGKAIISDGKNPLYDVPLKGLNLTEVKRSDLEVFRKLLERARRGAERDRKAALRKLRRGAIDASAASTAAKRYDDAIVNYFLGLHAYRDAVR